MKPTLITELETDKKYHKWGLYRCPYCGKEYSGRISEVESGRGYQHCGCQRSKRFSKTVLKKNDLTGKTFGRLTVLENDSGFKDKGNNILRKCICSCEEHNIVYKDYYYLTHAEEPSCGCVGKEKSAYIGKQNIKDLTGKRFGKLLVIKDSGDRRINNSGTAVIWECLCDCGNTTYVSSNDLVSNNTKSCGCLNSSANACIKNILQSLKIKFDDEHTFEECINPNTGHNLYFDFYLPNNNCCIEYDGKQHFSYSNNGWNTKEQVEATQYRDAIKNKYCEDNNIRLIRIPYWDYDKLNEEYLLDLISKEQTCVTPQR